MKISNTINLHSSLISQYNNKNQKDMTQTKMNRVTENPIKVSISQEGYEHIRSSLQQNGQETYDMVVRKIELSKKVRVMNYGYDLSMKAVEFNDAASENGTKALSVTDRANGYISAYASMYDEIVRGYENGTREVWTQDFEGGADYIEFEMDGRNYRFHKLTMEEELARLDRAYEKVARIAEDGANSMINTQKMLEKVIPEYQEKMREIEAQRAGRKLSEMGESPEIMAERIKDKLSMTEQSTERINLFEMFMEARKNWLNAEKI